MQATQQLIAALAYARFQSKDIEEGVKALINKMDGDLNEVGYETSAEVDTAVEELTNAINEADQNVEAVTGVDVDEEDEEGYEDEDSPKQEKLKRSNADRDI